MRPPYSYYGGKIGMAPQIVGLLPEHRCYIEPFFGSGAVLFAKPPAVHEIVNDVNAALITFWRVLRTRVHELEAVCTLTPHSRDEYEACVDLLTGPDGEPLDDLEIARRWWVRINQGFAKTGAATTGWSVTAGRNASVPSTILSRLGRFGPAAKRLAGVSIESCDAVDLIERFGGAEDVVIYADPPYLGDTRTDRSNRSGGDYLNDMMGEDDHRRLAHALNSTPGSVVLSGYDSPLYDELYRDWRRVERVVVAHSSNAAKSTSRYTRTEVLWCNFDPPAQLSLDMASLAVPA